MALGKKCRTCLNSKSSDLVAAAADEGLDLGAVRYTRGLGRKRVVISNNGEASPVDSSPMTPLKKLCGDRVVVDSDERSRLEALPQDVLVSPPKFSFLFFRAFISKFGIFGIFN